MVKGAGLKPQRGFLTRTEAERIDGCKGQTQLGDKGEFPIGPFHTDQTSLVIWALVSLWIGYFRYTVYFKCIFL